MTDQEILAALDRRTETIGTAYTECAKELGIPRLDVVHASLRRLLND